MSSITIVSDAPNCGVTYDCHYDDRNSFIIQATGIYPKGEQPNGTPLWLAPAFLINITLGWKGLPGRRAQAYLTSSSVMKKKVL